MMWNRDPIGGSFTLIEGRVGRVDFAEIGRTGVDPMRHRHGEFRLTGKVGLFFSAPLPAACLSLGFHGGQSSIECSHPCGDGRFLSYSL